MIPAPMPAHNAESRSNAGFWRNSSSLCPDRLQTRYLINSHRSAFWSKNMSHKEIPCITRQLTPDGKSSKRRMVPRRRLSYFLAARFGVRALRFESLGFCTNAWRVADSGACVGNGTGVAGRRPDAKGGHHG
jgi:hypothetical protein